MFDFHMHSKVSMDSETEPCDMIAAAERLGLCEICFTDHYDFLEGKTVEEVAFRIEDYDNAYRGATSEKLKIRYGVEMGLSPTNAPDIAEVLKKKDFDFIIGSLHYVDGYDPYFKEYWTGLTVKEAYKKYLDRLYECVLVHEDYDVLGHLTYVAKSPVNPTHEPLLYEDFPEVIDRILSEVLRRGKGIEVNTSGIDRIGEPLPSRRILERYYELGGRIVTVGSDAHVPENLGRHINKVLGLIKEIFGGVYTFEKRTPVFHKL